MKLRNWVILIVSILGLSAAGLAFATGLDFDTNKPSGTDVISTLDDYLRETRLGTYVFGSAEHTTQGKHKIPSTTTSGLATETPTSGRIIYNSTTGALLYGNGTSWIGTNGAIELPYANISNYSNDLTVAVATIGSTPTRLVIDGTATLSGHTTVPSTLVLDFIGAGKVTLGNYNLTLSGQVIAPSKKVFDYTGGGLTVRGSTGPTVVVPEWWGAVGDNATNDHTAITNTVNFFSTYPGTIFFPDGKIYYFTSALTVPSNLTLDFTSGSKLSLLNNAVTLNGQIVSNKTQVVTSAGSGVLKRGTTGQTSVYPEQFGTGFAGLAGANGYFVDFAGTIDLTSGEYPVTSSTSFTNATLNFLNDSTLSVSVGQVATLSNVIAPRRQIFSGAGTITLSANSTLPTSWFGGLVNLITQVTSGTAHHIIVDKVETVADNLTVASTYTTTFEPGFILTIANTKTLTFNGPVNTIPKQLFSCSGTGIVRFGSVGNRTYIPDPINVVWFGAVGDGVTDSTIPFEKAFASVDTTGTINPGQHGVTILVPPGEYVIADVIPSLNSSIQGYGPTSHTQIIRKSTATYGAFYCYTTSGGDGTSFKYLSFESTNSGNKASIYATSWPSLYISECWFNAGIGVYLDGTGDVRIDRCTFDSGDYGIKTGPNENYEVRITNNWFRHTTYNIYADALSRSIIANNCFHVSTYSSVSGVCFEPTTSLNYGNVIANNSFTVYDTDYYQQRAIYLKADAYNINVSGNIIRGGYNYAISAASTTSGINVSGNNIYLDDTKFAVTYPIKLDGPTSHVVNNIIDVSLVDAAKVFYSAISVGDKSSVMDNSVSVLWTHADARTLSTPLINFGGSYGIAQGNKIHLTDVTGILTTTYGILVASGKTDCRVKGNLYNINNTAVLTNPFYFVSAGNYSEMAATAVSADNGDASKTIYANKNSYVQRWATALTAERTVTVSAVSAYEGATFMIVRTAGNTGGPWNLVIAGLTAGSINMAADTWCIIVYNQTTGWMVAAKGAL